MSFFIKKFYNILNINTGDGDDIDVTEEGVIGERIIINNYDNNVDNESVININNNGTVRKSIFVNRFIKNTFVNRFYLKVPSLFNNDCLM